MLSPQIAQALDALLQVFGLRSLMTVVTMTLLAKALHPSIQKVPLAPWEQKGLDKILEPKPVAMGTHCYIQPA
jgi:hypothetical protein